MRVHGNHPFGGSDGPMLQGRVDIEAYERAARGVVVSSAPVPRGIGAALVLLAIGWGLGALSASLAIFLIMVTT